MECYASKTKTFGLLVLCMALIAASAFCITLDDLLANIFGWFGVVFCGLGGFVALRGGLRSGPAVVINEEGFEDKRSRTGLIPWDEVEAVTIESVSSSRFMAIHVDDTDKYVRQAPFCRRWYMRLNRVTGFPALCVSFVGLTPGLDAAWAYIQEIRPVDDDGPPDVAGAADSAAGGNTS